MQLVIPASLALDAYCVTLRSWLRETTDDDTALEQAGIALCISAREHDVPPEQLLTALHARGLTSVDGIGRSDTTGDRRYVHAVRLLMEAYFS
jgi:hypothetical protein